MLRACLCGRPPSVAEELSREGDGWPAAPIDTRPFEAAPVCILAAGARLPTLMPLFGRRHREDGSTTTFGDPRQPQLTCFRRAIFLLCGTCGLARLFVDLMPDIAHVLLCSLTNPMDCCVAVLAVD